MKQEIFSSRKPAMLKKPFKLIHKIDINRYYVVEFDRYNRYITTESIFFFKNNPNAKPKEMTQGIKMLRLSAPVLGILVGYYELPVEVETKRDKHIERYYPRMNIDPIRKWIMSLLESQEDLKDGQYQGITTPETYDNPTVKALIEEGFEMVGVIAEGSRTDTVILLKQNPLGIFRVAELVLTGKETGKSVVSLTTHTFNKDIAVKILDDLDNFRTKKSNKEIDKELERGKKK
jgi:hypothetical protein